MPLWILGKVPTLYWVFRRIGKPICRQIKSIVLLFLKYLVVRVLLYLRDGIKCYRLNVWKLWINCYFSFSLSSVYWFIVRYKLICVRYIFYKFYSGQFFFLIKRSFINCHGSYLYKVVISENITLTFLSFSVFIPLKIVMQYCFYTYIIKL